MFYFEFKNQNSRQYGIEVTTRPSIPAPQPRGEFVDIAGRDGSLLVTDGTYQDIQIDISLNFVRNRDKVNEQYRRAKAWLSGAGILRMSDDADAFYKVKAAFISDYSRAAKGGAKFIASFTCDPFTYLNSGTEPIEPGTIINPYQLAKPTYKVTGESVFTLTVNGNEVSSNVGQNLTIDTELLVAYREDGTVANHATTGDFESLWLPSGTNEISITGATLSIIPNWRAL